MRDVVFRIPDIRLETIKEYAKKVKEIYPYNNTDYIQNLTLERYEIDIPLKSHRGNYLITQNMYLYWAWDPEQFFDEGEEYDIIDLCGDGFIGGL